MTPRLVLVHLHLLLLVALAAVEEVDLEVAAVEGAAVEVDLEVAAVVVEGAAEPEGSITT